MWFHLGCQNFIAKKSLKSDFECDVFVCDFIRIWHKTLSNTELISTSQSMNPLLETSVQKLKEITLNSLEDVKAQKNIQEENNKITLSLESNILGLKFRFKVTLDQGNSEMLFQEFTLPLLILLKNMQNQEKQLIKIIQDKDEEIAEFKQECGHIKSYFTVTKPFIKGELNNYESNSIPWNLNSFLDSIKFLSSEKLYKGEDVKPMHEKKDQKCLKIKADDGSQSASNDKSVTKKICSKHCVSLDNQIIKKRKKNVSKLNF